MELPLGTTTFLLQETDCVAGMREGLKDGEVDLIVTSPPYNLGVAYSEYNDGQEREAYLGWTREWGAEVKRVLAEDGSLFLNVGASPKNPLLPHQLALLFSELFVLQNTFHWVKSITVERRDGEQVSVGHFKPINSKRFVTDLHEPVFHFTKKGNVPLDRLALGVPYQDKSNIERWEHTEGKDLRCRGNTWFIPYQTIQSRAGERPHPATFPVQLAEWCVRLAGRAAAGITMLDPFLGIGHAAVAAENLGVGRFVGYEIDGEYLAVACEKVGVTP
ncbi:MAG: site-specific DNA-methyltransferase [Verrucomicrobiota bacterium]